ncbi:MAG TPA: Uma2 family endonuclease [Vicinamibacteria bacterium]|nr:Uma2 family endonuclease [Vicinamibacteria bacterium]
MSAAISRHLFTTQEFRAMIEAGVFQEDDRLELVDGEIVEMSPIGSRHAACVRKLIRLLRSVGDRALLDVQNPLGVSDDNDFYPDVVLLRPRSDDYAGGIPPASDTILVVEVSDTTLQFDRSIKKPRYAAAGAPELWIVDLEGSRVWVHRKPLEGDYGEVFEARSGDVLKVPGMPDVEIPVVDLVP